MSSAADIASRVAAMEHDAAFWSLFLGEPRVFDDLVGYYDGRQLFLFGAALGSRLPADDGVVQGIFEYGLDRLGIEYFECWRPGEPPSIHSPDWTVGEYRELGVPMAIPLEGFTLAESTGRAKQIRQAEARGFTCETVKSCFLEDGDIRLIERFLAEKDLAPFDISYNALVSYFLNSPNGRVFRVRREAKVCALGTVSVFPSESTTFVHTFVDRSERGASDFLYKEVIAYAIGRGSRYLDLGYSAMESLVRYKASWGAEAAGSPNGGAFAAAPHVAGTKFYHWPMRLLVGERY
jgi:hypothetical protein